MPAVANIVLADALVTPVNHTFIPMGRDDSGAYWYEDQSQASPIGFWKISLELRKPKPGAPGSSSSSDRNCRVIVTLHEPALETLGTNDAGVTPPPTVAYIARQKTEFILPERSALQNRKDIRKMGMNLLNDSQVIAMVENFQNVY